MSKVATFIIRVPVDVDFEPDDTLEGLQEYVERIAPDVLANSDVVYTVRFDYTTVYEDDAA